MGLSTHSRQTAGFFKRPVQRPQAPRFGSWRAMRFAVRRRSCRSLERSGGAHACPRVAWGRVTRPLMGGLEEDRRSSEEQRPRATSISHAGPTKGFRKAPPAYRVEQPALAASLSRESRHEGGQQQAVEQPPDRGVLSAEALRHHRRPPKRQRAVSSAQGLAGHLERVGRHGGAVQEAL